MDFELMLDVCEVVITAPDADWLAGFTRRLVDDHLAAGSHHVTTIRAIYRWQDDVHDRTEARVALHTRTELVPAIVDRADAEHPYEVPCVVALPIISGNPAYLDWIREQTIVTTVQAPSR
jgi:periplasmic divalent cation tolerance protein